MTIEEFERVKEGAWLLVVASEHPCFGRIGAVVSVEEGMGVELVFSPQERPRFFWYGSVEALPLSFGPLFVREAPRVDFQPSRLGGKAGVSP